MDSELPLRRIVAFLIDRLVGLAPTFVFGVFFFVLLLGGEALEALAALMLGLGFLSFIFFNIGYMLLRDGLFDGRSLGKRVMGLKVMDSRGKPCGIGDSVLRNIIFFIPILPLIELILVLIDPGQRIGDKWAKTKVVRSRY